MLGDDSESSSRAGAASPMAAGALPAPCCSRSTLVRGVGLMDSYCFHAAGCCLCYSSGYIWWSDTCGQGGDEGYLQSSSSPLMWIPS